MASAQHSQWDSRSQPRIHFVQDPNQPAHHGLNSIEYLSQWSPAPILHNHRLPTKAVMVTSSGLVFCGVTTIIVQIVSILMDPTDDSGLVSTGIWNGLVCMILAILGFKATSKASKTYIWWMLTMCLVNCISTAAAICLNIFTIQNSSGDNTIVILHIINLTFFFLDILLILIDIICVIQGLCGKDIVRDYEVSPRVVMRPPQGVIVPLAVLDEEDEDGFDLERPRGGARAPKSPPFVVLQPGQFSTYLSGPSSVGQVNYAYQPKANPSDPRRQQPPHMRMSSVPIHGVPFDPKDFRNDHLRTQSMIEPQNGFQKVFAAPNEPLRGRSYH